MGGILEPGASLVVETALVPKVGLEPESKRAKRAYLALGWSQSSTVDVLEPGTSLEVGLAWRPKP